MLSNLLEFSAGPAQLDRASGVLRDTVIITSLSQNGRGKGGRRYSDGALKQIAAMAEGLPAYLNHVPASDAFKPRDVRDLIGVHRNVRYHPHEGKITSDLHVMEHQIPLVFGIATQLGDRVGNSLVSRGRVEMEGDTEVVKEILAVRSADLVSDPATTKGLFESRLDLGTSPVERVERLRAAIEGRPFEPLALRTRRTALVEALRRGNPLAVILDGDHIPEGSHARLAAAVRHEKAWAALPQGIHQRLTQAFDARAAPLPDAAIHQRLARAVQR